MLLFPDMVPDPAIDAQAKRSNFHVLWDTDKLTGRIAERSLAGKDLQPLNIGAVGPRRRSRWAHAASRRDFSLSLTDRQAQPTLASHPDPVDQRP